MKLMTKAQYDQLIKNGQASLESEGGIDHKPVIKLFSPVGAATWLISELDPEDPDIAFGLADLGMGCPELGSVSMKELEGVTLRFGLKIERDLYWEADKTLGQYAEEARKNGRIMT
jgi:hypothetical protein